MNALLRNLLLILVTSCLIILPGVFIIQTLEREAEQLCSQFRPLEQLILAEDWQQLEARYGEFRQQWNEINKTWAVFIAHSELDMIDQAQARLAAYIRLQSSAEALAEFNEMLFLLEHIPLKEQLTLSNIS